MAEIQLTSAVGVAGESEVVRKADIRPHLHGVVAADFRPVVHELVLMLVFNQRAVAARGPKAIAEIRERAVKIESWQASR